MPPKPKKEPNLENVVNKEKYHCFEKIVADAKKERITAMKLVIGIDFSNSNEFTGNKMYK